MDFWHVYPGFCESAIGELHSLKNWELKFSDFFDKRAVTGNIHMKTSQEQKIRREPFIWAVLVLDKTCSYKWYCCVLCKTQLSFLRINGPNVYIYISFLIKSWHTLSISKLLSGKFISYLSYCTRQVNLNLFIVICPWLTFRSSSFINMYIKSLIFSAFSNLLNTWVSRLKKFEDILNNRRH